MNTPILDFLTDYAASDVARLHMPGHKGRGPLGCEALDITEVRGADTLYEASGIIAESERNATALFGSGHTLYSTEGSSHAIRTMLLLAKQRFARPGQRTVLAARNAHKAFLYGLAVLDLDVRWLYPEAGAENSIASCPVTPEQLRRELQALSGTVSFPFAVYVTSPDYLGALQDIRGLADVCSAFDLPLLVDNAHGAYLHFLPEPMHPLDLGAAMCCDSAHKTLPVLTGGAYLQIAPGIVSLREAKEALEVTGSTSPSYLIMASLDSANAFMAGDFRARLAKMMRALDAIREELRAAGVPVLPSEPLKIVVDAAAMGMTGETLGDALRTHGAEPEFCDADYLVCMLTVDNTKEDLRRLRKALLAARKHGLPPRAKQRLVLMPLGRAMSIRKAVMARHETVPLEEAAGRVLGAPTVSCPPAIPIAVSGERLTEDALALMRAYGIEAVSCVREA